MAASRVSTPFRGSSRPTNNTSTRATSSLSSASSSGGDVRSTEPERSDRDPKRVERLRVSLRDGFDHSDAVGVEKVGRLERLVFEGQQQ